MAMKVSFKCGRFDKSGKHNDRNFDISKSGHIDGARSKDNKYWVYNGDYSQTLDENELGYYNEHFGEYVGKRKEKYKEAHNKKRARNATVKKYISSVNTMPEDVIFQIGNKDEYPPPEVLWQIAQEYRDKFNEKYGDHCEIINMSLHLDEATPHVHMRRVWKTIDDETGLMRENQGQALVDLGYKQIPQEEEKKNNNGKVDFTYDDRTMLYDIIIEHIPDIDITHPVKRRSLSTTEYKRQQEEHRLNDLEEKTREENERYDKLVESVDKAQEELDQLNETIEKEHEEALERDLQFVLLLTEYLRGKDVRDEYEKEIRTLNRTEALKKVLNDTKKLINIVEHNVLPELRRADKSTLQTVTDNALLKEQLAEFKRFISEQGLEQEYSRYTESEKENDISESESRRDKRFK